jgi:hypothetical protein
MDPAKQWSKEQLRYLVNHISFPPKCPQSRDESDENNQFLLDFMSETALKYENLMPDSTKQAWQNVRTMWQRSSRVSDQGYMAVDSLVSAFESLHDSSMDRQISHIGRTIVTRNRLPLSLFQATELRNPHRTSRNKRSHLQALRGLCLCRKSYTIKRCTTVDLSCCQCSN